MQIQSFLTVKQAAERLNLSEATIRAWIFRRKKGLSGIGFVKFGAAVRIPEEEILRLIAAGTPKQEGR